MSKLNGHSRHDPDAEPSNVTSLDAARKAAEQKRREQARRKARWGSTGGTTDGQTGAGDAAKGSNRGRDMMIGGIFILMAIGAIVHFASQAYHSVAGGTP